MLFGDKRVVFWLKRELRVRQLLWHRGNKSSFLHFLPDFEIELYTLPDYSELGYYMSWLEENIGEGYQQVVIGFAVFIIGAILGWMEAADNMMSASDVYMPAVIMLSGAMVTMLGLSFGTGHEDDRTDDLMNAINELTARMNSMLGSEEE